MESNYDKTVRIAQGLFLEYDQDAIADRFGLERDGSYLYVTFIGERYRISRQSGAVDVLTEDGPAGCADFNIVMSIFDALCYPTQTPALAHDWCPLHGLQVTMSSPNADIFNQKYANAFSGKADKLWSACRKLGGTKTAISAGADVHCQFDVFPFFPIQFRFWDADDEFPAQIRLLWDRNALQFMRFETLYYVMGALMNKLYGAFQG